MESHKQRELLDSVVYGVLSFRLLIYLVHVGHKILQLLQPLANPCSSFLEVEQQGKKNDFSFDIQYQSCIDSIAYFDTSTLANELGTELTLSAMLRG